MIAKEFSCKWQKRLTPPRFSFRSSFFLEEKAIDKRVVHFGILKILEVTIVWDGPYFVTMLLNKLMHAPSRKAFGFGERLADVKRPSYLIFRRDVPAGLYRLLPFSCVHEIICERVFGF